MNQWVNWNIKLVKEDPQAAEPCYQGEGPVEVQNDEKIEKGGKAQ